MTPISFVIFPNPAKNNFIVTSSSLGDFTLVIYSLEGKQVLSLNGVANSTSIDVSMLETGVYIIEVEKEGGVSRKRLVVQN